ncbi:hypothetical protein PAP18089_02293 [Pandoraea apista]|uniref:Uncharacterized protein n=1 Tax=Pandoraea apista TaxID=93218 RepID=A0A5E5P3Y7_9BURK|nr:hypothetical protein PAP18089_02293 [Pandoraea apista]
MPHATPTHGPLTPTTPLTPKPPARRSLRVPRRARLGDPPLLRRVGDELAYTPTRCRVSAGLKGRADPWWQRFSPSRPGHNSTPEP